MLSLSLILITIFFKNKSLNIKFNYIVTTLQTPGREKKAEIVFFFFFVYNLLTTPGVKGMGWPDGTCSSSRGWLAEEDKQEKGNWERKLKLGDERSGKRGTGRVWSREKKNEERRGAQEGTGKLCSGGDFVLVSFTSPYFFQRMLLPFFIYIPGSVFFFFFIID